jgi:hypothetical protein
MENMVSWSDYEGVEGFGTQSRAHVDELNKALTVGQSIDAPGSVVAGDGFALRVESLENTLKNVTFSMNEIKFWKAIPKLPAYNTVEEHNVLSSYGENPDAGWIDEGDLPESDDSSYERQYAVVKYLGTTRKVSHVASLVKPAHGAIVGQETVNGTMHLLRILERALFYGDSDMSPLQFDGYRKLLIDNSPADNIIDLRGQPLSEDILTDACLTASDRPNYGQITHMHCNPKVKADLIKTFFPKERHDTFTANGGMVGLDIKGFTSSSGDVAIEANTFINDGGAPNAAAVGDAAKRPASPTISTAATTPVEAAAQFDVDDAGDYYYKIVAVNRYGRSAAVNVDAGAISVVAGDKVTFGVTPAAAGVEHYEVYRSQKNGSLDNVRSCFKVKNTAGAGELTVNDLNADLPFTTEAFLFQQNLQSLSFKQLAPMLKIPLATIDTSIRWSQILYGVPVLYAPKKNVLIKNIGRAAGFVGAV